VLKLPACTSGDTCSAGGTCAGTPLTCPGCVVPYECTCGTCTCPVSQSTGHSIDFQGSIGEDLIAATGLVLGCFNMGGQGCASSGYLTVSRNGVVLGQNIALQLSPDCQDSQWNSATFNDWNSATFNDWIYSPNAYTFPGQPDGPFQFADQNGFLFGSEGPVTAHLYSCSACGAATPYRLDVTVSMTTTTPATRKRATTVQTFSVGGTLAVASVESTAGTE
jgi:hypothetical protein